MSDTEGNICNCGKLYSLNCNNKLCGSCCTDITCNNHTSRLRNKMIQEEKLKYKGVNKKKKIQCNCGSSASPYCKNSMCCRCCNDTLCTSCVEKRLNKEKHILSRLCPCGEKFSYECENKLCHKCCKDETCLRHTSGTTTNICSCGEYYYSLTCRNKLCEVCCYDTRDYLCTSKHIVYRNGEQYTGKVIKPNFTEITKILQKTVLPDNIIDYILEDFVNTNKKCIMCNRKNEHFIKCEKCERNYCKNCTLNKEFVNNHSLCKKCFPKITNIYDIYKNVCYCCNSCDNYNKRPNKSCEICNKTVCNSCHFIRYCHDCYNTLDKDNVDISNEPNYFRCNECNEIKSNFYKKTCKNCNNKYCNNCIENCECSWDNSNICKNCTKECIDCKKNLCNSCDDNCYECDNIICSSCSRGCKYCDTYSCDTCHDWCKMCTEPICNQCKKSCPVCYNSLCKECKIEEKFCEECVDYYTFCTSCKTLTEKKYTCNYCDQEFCQNCTEECKSCENSICFDCYTENNLNGLICSECKY